METLDLPLSERSPVLAHAPQQAGNAGDTLLYSAKYAGLDANDYVERTRGDGCHESEMEAGEEGFR
jgi:hypothetical protein